MLERRMLNGLNVEFDIEGDVVKSICISSVVNKLNNRHMFILKLKSKDFMKCYQTIHLLSRKPSLSNIYLFRTSNKDYYAVSFVSIDWKMYKKFLFTNTEDEFKYDTLNNKESKIKFELCNGIDDCNTYIGDLIHFTTYRRNENKIMKRTFMDLIKKKRDGENSTEVKVEETKERSEVVSTEPHEEG